MLEEAEELVSEGEVAPPQGLSADPQIAALLAAAGAESEADLKGVIASIAPLLGLTVVPEVLEDLPNEMCEPVAIATEAGPVVEETGDGAVEVELDLESVELDPTSEGLEEPEGPEEPVFAGVLGVGDRRRRPGFGC